MPSPHFSLYIFFSLNANLIAPCTWGSVPLPYQVMYQSLLLPVETTEVGAPVWGNRFTWPHEWASSDPWQPTHTHTITSSLSKQSMVVPILGQDTTMHKNNTILLPGNPNSGWRKAEFCDLNKLETKQIHTLFCIHIQKLCSCAWLWPLTFYEFKIPKIQEMPANNHRNNR